MCAFQAKGGLQKRDGLRKIALPFIVSENPGEFFSMDNDIETANLCKAELLLLQAGGMHLLPHSVVYGKQDIGGNKQDVSYWVLPAFRALSTAA
jgi:hypothetical protein